MIKGLWRTEGTLVVSSESVLFPFFLRFNRQSSLGRTRLHHARPPIPVRDLVDDVVWPDDDFQNVFGSRPYPGEGTLGTICFKDMLFVYWWWPPDLTSTWKSINRLSPRLKVIKIQFHSKVPQIYPIKGGRNHLRSTFRVNVKLLFYPGKGILSYTLLSRPVFIKTPLHPLLNMKYPTRDSSTIE